MKKIDKEIQDAIREAVSELHTQAELARRSGLPAQHINRYLSGEIKGITLDNWVKLEPWIRPYLPSDPLVPKGYLHALTMAPSCPLADCPAKGIPHEPLTEELLREWAELDKSEKLDALKALSEIAAKRLAAVGDESATPSAARCRRPATPGGD